MSVLEYMKIADRLADLYSVEEANEWLTGPHPQLEGRIPIEGPYLEVAAIIDRLESGAYL